MPGTLREATGTHQVCVPVYYTAMQRTTKQQTRTRWYRGSNAFVHIFDSFEKNGLTNKTVTKCKLSPPEVRGVVCYSDPRAPLRETLWDHLKHKRDY